MKKRNLFIGIALVAVILVALYLANYGSIFEGNQSGSVVEITIPNAPKNPYTVTKEDNDRLKTIEDILNGTLKMDGKGTADLKEYYNDLKDNSICVNESSDNSGLALNKIMTIVNNEPTGIIEMKDKLVAPAKLSYNDTFQVIYTFGKVAASFEKQTGKEFVDQLKILTPYLYIYSAFTSKLLANINALGINDTNMIVLSNILNSYYYSVSEEGTSPSSKVNVSLLSSLSYVREICRKFYQTGFGGWPASFDDAVGPPPKKEKTIGMINNGLVFFFCNFTGKVPPKGGKPFGVLNYTIPNLQQKISNIININKPVSVNKDIAPSDPLFMQRLAISVDVNNDRSDAKMFGPYQKIGEKSLGDKRVEFYKMEELNKFLSSGSTEKPIWFNTQPVVNPIISVAPPK